MAPYYYQTNNDLRQKLIRSGKEKRARRVPVIKDLRDLKNHLQMAILVEHFTIPPYLCALYSIKEGTNDEASRLIRSVVVEEMLHMVMVANILNALGEKPKIKEKEFIPIYPHTLPYTSGKFVVNLLKFSKESINTFLRIEKPAEESDSKTPGKFDSIGEFYAAIREALDREEKKAKKKGKTIFTSGNRQVTPEHYYGAGGKLIVVNCLDDAFAAIDEIVGQGEGIDGGINDADDEMFDDDVEFAHYFRFNEIFHERYYEAKVDKLHDTPSGRPMRVDWNDVHNMKPNPKMADYIETNPWLYSKMKDFNKTYMDLLENLEEGCTGKPQVLREGIHIMFRLKEQAVELMKIPSDEGNYTLGPSFEYVEG